MVPFPASVTFMAQTALSVKSLVASVLVVLSSLAKDATAARLATMASLTADPVPAPPLPFVNQRLVNVSAHREWRVTAVTAVHPTPMVMTPSLVVRSASAHPWVCELAICSVTFSPASVIARTMWWAADVTGVQLATGALLSASYVIVTCEAVKQTFAVRKMQGVTVSSMSKDALVTLVGRDLTTWRRAIQMAVRNASALVKLTIAPLLMHTGQRWCLMI